MSMGDDLDSGKITEFPDLNRTDFFGLKLFLVGEVLRINVSTSSFGTSLVSL